jgi:hypothetical protein
MILSVRRRLENLVFTPLYYSNLIWLSSPWDTTEDKASDFSLRKELFQRQV